MTTTRIPPSVVWRRQENSRLWKRTRPIRSIVRIEPLTTTEIGTSRVPHWKAARIVRMVKPDIASWRASKRLACFQTWPYRPQAKLLASTTATTIGANDQNCDQRSVGTPPSKRRTSIAAKATSASSASSATMTTSLFIRTVRPATRAHPRRTLLCSSLAKLLCSIIPPAPRSRPGCPRGRRVPAALGVLREYRSPRKLG